jgi:hypothetical protein
VASDFEQWLAQFPTKEARQDHLNRCGGTEYRGANCERTVFAPESITDPIPYREIEGGVSYGVNLDGTEDGRETETTCAHENFVHPDGATGVDNQLYRFLGCLRNARSGAFRSHESERGGLRVVEHQKLRILLEVRGVDNEQNDSDVDVFLYQSSDLLITDMNSMPVPWQTQTVDATIPAVQMHGRIEDGVLITEPADAYWEDLTWMAFEPAVLVRGSQLQLKLTETGAKGLRTGYVDADSWWRTRRFLQTWEFYNDSPPSTYEALHRLADGYKDPETGQCTALSSAIELDFTRVYIRHPDEDEKSELASLK